MTLRSRSWTNRGLC